MTNNAAKALVKESTWIENTLKISMVTIFFTLLIYFVVFRYGLSSDRDDWGAFGSYFGGIVGSMVAFCALIALMKGITLQQSEFKYLREAQEQQRFNEGAAIVLKDALEKIEKITTETFVEATYTSNPEKDHFKGSPTNWADKKPVFKLLRANAADDWKTLKEHDERMIRSAGFEISYQHMDYNYPDFVQSANNILRPVCQLLDRFDMSDKWKLNPINLYYSQQFEKYFNWYGMAGFSCCYNRMTASRINRQTDQFDNSES